MNNQSEKIIKNLIPYAVLCELTHRCPLSCPYCSNPVNLETKSNEIDTSIWKRVLTEASEMGYFQAHFSGGEPTARKDLEELNSACMFTGTLYKSHNICSFIRRKTS